MLVTGLIVLFPQHFQRPDSSGYKKQDKTVSQNTNTKGKKHFLHCLVTLRFNAQKEIISV